MAVYIKLNWTDPNVGAHTVNIYRGDTQLDRTALANPIATLSNGEVTYTDTNVSLGKSYYYVIETVLGTDKTSTQNILLRAQIRRGPGPASMTVGDYDMGYYGTIESAQFVNATTLMNAMGLAFTVTMNSPTWHKFVRNNKICFIPTGSIASGAGWTALYNAGCVFGVDTAGPYNAGSDVLQNKKITIGPDTFRVRLMRGYNDDNSVFCTTAAAEPTETFTCEWDDFVYPISKLVPTVQRLVNVNSYLYTDYRLSSQTTIICQEKATSGTSSVCVTRGASLATRQGIANRLITQDLTTNSVRGWWPVLELIES